MGWTNEKPPESCCHDSTNWPNYCYVGETCDQTTGFCTTGGTPTTGGGTTAPPTTQAGSCTNHDQCSQACSSQCPAGVFGCCDGCDIGQCVNGACKCVRSESYCANPAMQIWAQCTSATTICNKACSDKGYKYYNCDYNTCQSPFVAISGSCSGLGGGRQCCCSNGGTTPTTLAPTGCDYACGGSYKFYSCSYSTCSAPFHKTTGSCSGLGSGTCCCTNCGNGYCSSIDGENAQNCPQDCTTTPAVSCPNACGSGGWSYYTCFYSVCQSPLVHITGSCAGLDAGTCCCTN